MNLTPALARLIRVARRLGVPKFVRNIPEHEIDSSAFELGRLLQARLWMRRQGAAGWTQIHDGWRRALEPGAPAVREALSGTLDAEDQLRLLDDPQTVFAAHADLYSRATRTIDIATYYMQADETGWSIARLLAACVERGVRVRLLADRYATAKKRYAVAGMDELFDFLRRSGVAVRLWHDPARPFDSSHRKMIVVDERSCIVGGRNFANHYQDGSWRDIDVVLTGPIARRLAPVFEAAWSEESPTPRPPGAAAPWFEHVPALVDRDPTVRYVLACVEAVERTLDLELAYFVGPGPLCDALVRAAHRGVRVRLLTNSAESTDLPHKSYATYAGVKALLDAGATVFLRRGRDRTLHCKYLVADGEWVSFGSHNLDRYSSRRCCEVNLHAHSARFGGLLTAFFETGLAASTPADPGQDVSAVLARGHGRALLDWVLRDP